MTNEQAQRVGVNIVRSVLVTVFYAGAFVGAMVGALAVMLARAVS